MAFEKDLLDVLVCPLCGGALEHHTKEQRLVCRFDRLSYPIRDGVPVMLPDEADPWEP